MHRLRTVCVRLLRAYDTGGSTALASELDAVFGVHTTDQIRGAVIGALVADGTGRP